MLVGYPRFFVQKIIQELATVILGALNNIILPSNALAMLFPTQEDAERCAEFVRSSCPEDHLQIVCGVSGRDAGRLGDDWTCVYALIHAKESLPYAKKFWQHTGSGISSRRAEHTLSLFQKEGLHICYEPFVKIPLQKLESEIDHVRFEKVCDGAGVSEKIIVRERVAQLLSDGPTGIKVPLTDVFLYPAGMKAIYDVYRAMMLVFPQRQKTVTYGFLYVDTEKILSRFGTKDSIFYGFGGSEELGILEHTLSTGTEIMALFCEFPGNPLLKTPDLKRIRELADRFDFVVVCDDTLGTSVNCDLLPYADVIVTSLTKLFSGSCNVMGGTATINPLSRHHAKIHECLSSLFVDTYYLEDAVAMELSSRDFVQRVYTTNSNAVIIADILERHESVETVFYPSLGDGKSLYDRCRRPGGGYGYLLSVKFKHNSDAIRFHDALNVAKGPSLGTNFTLVCGYTLFAHYYELDWAARYGVSEHLIRISIGMEPASYLVNVFNKALGSLKTTPSSICSGECKVMSLEQAASSSKEALSTERQMPSSQEEHGTTDAEIATSPLEQSDSAQCDNSPCCSPADDTNNTMAPVGDKSDIGRDSSSAPLDHQDKDTGTILATEPRGTADCRDSQCSADPCSTSDSSRTLVTESSGLTRVNSTLASSAGQLSDIPSSTVSSSEDEHSSHDVKTSHSNEKPDADINGRDARPEDCHLSSDPPAKGHLSFKKEPLPGKPSSKKHSKEHIHTPGHAPDEYVNIDFSHIDEKKVLRKMDFRLIPALTLLYMVCYVNRGNIGNAKIQGLTEDLHMSGAKYNLCLMVYFFTYCIFMVPSNLLLKKFRPSRWLPFIMVCSGITMTLTGLIQGYKSLLLARAFLGATDSGVYSGITYFLTMWYCRHESQLRQAMVFSATGFAGAFSGLLAFLIAKMDGIAGLYGWQWIFILEGFSTVVSAVLSFFMMNDFPSTATFLTPEERAWVLHRLKYQNYKGSGEHVAEADRFHWNHVRAAFTDWQVLVATVMFWGIICPLYGIALFLPTIINELGHNAATSQLLTIPIYLTASVLTILLAWHSDRSKRGRARYIFIPMCFILAGFTIAIVASAHGGLPIVVYAGMLIATCGTLPAFPGNITWLSSNLSGSYKRSAGMAIQIGVGNLGGVFVSNFYREEDAPQYLMGHGLEIAVVSLGMIAVIVLRVGYARVNKKREREGNKRSYSLSQMSHMGDRAPTFRWFFRPIGGFSWEVIEDTLFL
ncbi:hypothetical protein G7Y89_g8220 [Cudoniella acicularis]|uniref:Major facilitator superfamily (MFS) profile domain-containing protein n=1 Tax=Cudoniella acicularis TaxID=354080 RepID=A0A8H4RJA2_9HELO|nr:hypothetical protein G7Y89_g8220 [Cudoniella acicularis]